MNSMNIWQERLRPITNVLSDAALLVVRVWLAQEFLFAAYTKLSSGFTPPEWFGGLKFPFPISEFPAAFNWGAVGIAELVFGLMLLLGVGARLAALALLFITYVAVYSVHFDLSWSGWNQIETDDGLGFKVPLMIGVMLLVVLGQGAGRWSIDGMIAAFKRT